MVPRWKETAISATTSVVSGEPAKMRIGHWAVRVVDANGRKSVRLTDEHKNSGSPAWSPDGKHIAFDQFVDEKGRQQVFVMNAAGSNVRQLTTDTA